MTKHPEQLFELFYRNVRQDMNPLHLRRGAGMRLWWYERFMNALHGIEEPYSLRSWAEAPQMWLAGYRENQKETQIEAEAKPKFVPPPPLIPL